MCVRGGGGEGNQDVITIQTYTMTPLSATVLLSVSVLAGAVGQWLQMHFTLTTRVGTCVRLITMEMSTYLK